MHDHRQQCVLFVGEPSLCERLAVRICALSDNVASPGSLRHIIGIANKYYTAEVQVVICAADRVEQDLAAVCLSHSIEGVVLVSRRDCVDAARQLEVVSRIEEGPEIRMMVVDTAERVPDSHAWKRGVTYVCTEHCTEYCEVSLANETLDDDLYKNDDPEGCQRVLEALGAHIWPEMTPTQPRRRSEPAFSQKWSGTGDAARAEESERIMRDLQAFQSRAGQLSGEQRVEQASELMERFALAHGIDDGGPGDIVSSDDASSDSEQRLRASIEQRRGQ